MSETQKKRSRILTLVLPFILPICMILTGAICIYRWDLVNSLFMGLGIASAVIGVVEIIIYAARRKYEAMPRLLVTGILLLIIGIFLMLVPTVLNGIIPIVISLCIIITGISGVINTISYHDKEDPILLPMIFAMINIIGGAILFIYTLTHPYYVGYVSIGVMLIISGIIRIINEIFARTAKPKSQSGAVIDHEANHE